MKKRLAIIAIGLTVSLILGGLNSMMLYSTEYLSSDKSYSFSVASQVTWWNCNWSYSKRIIIDHDKVQSDLTNYPVLIRRDSDSDLLANTQSDGGDIVFIDRYNSTQYYHEIEEYDSGTGELSAWVMIPSVSSTEDTIIYMYYGNTNCENQWNIESTWNSNYKMVQHLNETSGTLQDSTSSNNDGANTGGASSSSSGQIDGAYDFTGTEYINCGNDSSLDIESAITIEGWVKDPPWFHKSFNKKVEIVDKREEKIFGEIGSTISTNRTIKSNYETEVIFIAIHTKGVEIKDISIDDESILNNIYDRSNKNYSNDEIENIIDKLPEKIKELHYFAVSKPLRIDSKKTIQIYATTKNNENNRISYIVLSKEGIYDYETTTHIDVLIKFREKNLIYEKFPFIKSYVSYNKNKKYIREVDSKEANDLITKNGFVILDIRSKDDYSVKHIPGSISFEDSSCSICTSNIYDKYKDKKILIYDNDGTKSKLVSNNFLDKGFKEIYIIKNGFNEWVNKGYPIEGPKVYSFLNKINKTLVENKPVFLFFYSDSCGYCADQIEANKKIMKNFSEEVDFININLGEYPEVFNHFGVNSYPTMFFVKDKNNEGFSFKDFIGYNSKEVLSDFFTKYFENSISEDYWWKGKIKPHRAIGLPADIAGSISENNKAKVIVRIDRSKDLALDGSSFSNFKNVYSDESNIYLSGLLDSETYNEIKYDENIIGFYSDEKFSVLLDESLPLINYNKSYDEFGYTGKGTKICILDTGVDSSVVDYSYGYDFIDDDSIPEDNNGHGTRVASVINSIAPDADIIVAKVISDDGSGYESTVIQGLEWCIDQEPDIISFSIGTTKSCNGFCDSNIVSYIANKAYEQGIFVVAASGNNGLKNISAPACGSNVFSVGATDDFDNIASFSNVNPTLDIFAPGVNITTKAGTSSGTSMSAPFVSAAVSLFFEKENITNLDSLKYRLRSTGKPIDYSYNESLEIKIGRLDIYNFLSNITTMKPYNYSYWWQSIITDENYTSFGTCDEECARSCGRDWTGACGPADGGAPACCGASGCKLCESCYGCNPPFTPYCYCFCSTPPTVSTSAIQAGDIGETSATLRGSVDSVACGGFGSKGFKFRRHSDGTYTDCVTPALPLTTGSYTKSCPASGSFVRGELYLYYAVATDIGGEGDGSPADEFLTKPAQLSSFSATAEGSSQISLDWTHGTGGDKVYLEYTTNEEVYESWSKGDGTVVPGGTSGVFSGTDTTHSSLDPSTTYFYKAWPIAVDGDGVVGMFESNGDDNKPYGTTSTDSATTSAAPTVNRAPEIDETSESPTNQSTGVSTQPTCSITVNDPDGDDMNIQFWENSTETWTRRQTNESVGNGTYTWDFSQASSEGTKYWWRVRARDLYQNVTPDSNYDPDSAWGSETNAYDDDTGTSANTGTARAYLYFNVSSPINCSAIRLYSALLTKGGDEDLVIFKLDVYDGTSWTTIDSDSTISANTWTTIDNIAENVTIESARISIAEVPEHTDAQIKEFRFVETHENVSTYHFTTESGENEPPYATNLAISADHNFTLDNLSGTYSYNDNESDLEAGTSFEWYESEDNSTWHAIGVNSTWLDSNSTNESWFYKFEVTPRDATGTGSTQNSSVFEVLSLTEAAGTYSGSYVEAGKLTIEGGPASLTISGTIDIEGDVKVLNEGTLALGSNDHELGSLYSDHSTITATSGTMYITDLNSTSGYSLNLQSMTFTNSSGTIQINSTTASKIKLSSLSSKIYDLNINAGAAVSWDGNTEIGGDLTISSGTFKGQSTSDTIRVYDDATVNNGGTLGKNGADADWTFGSLTESSGGTIEATSGCIYITDVSSGLYALDLDGTYTNNSGAIEIRTDANTIVVDLVCTGSVYDLIINLDDGTDNVGWYDVDPGDTIIGNNLTITSGAFLPVTGSYPITVTNDVTVNGGTLGGGVGTGLPWEFGSLDLESGTVDATSGTITITKEDISGDAIDLEGGTFTNNSGTVQIETSGATEAKLSASSGGIYDLIINSGSTVDWNGNTNIGNDLTVSSGTFQPNAEGDTLSIVNDVTVSGGTLGGNSASGTWTMSSLTQSSGTIDATTDSIIITSEPTGGTAFDIDGVFTSNSGTVEINTAAETNIDITGTGNLYDLIIDTSGNIVTNTVSATVDNNITIQSGKLLLNSDLATNEMQIDSGAEFEIDSDSSFTMNSHPLTLNGYFNVTDGDAISLNLTGTTTTFNLTDAANISLHTTPENPSNPSGWLNINKYVNLTDYGSSPTVDINITYDESDLGSIDESTLVIREYNWSEDSWTTASDTGVDTASNYVYANGVTDFSIYAPLGQEANVRPTITSLHADGTGNGNEWDQDDDDVQIDWTVNDDDGDDLWLIFNYSAGGTPGIPTNTSNQASLKVTDGGTPGYSGSNYDLDWTDATGWVDTTDDITICMRAWDGTAYSRCYNDTNLTGIDGTNPTSIDPMSDYEEDGDPDEVYGDTAADTFYFSNSFDSNCQITFDCTFSDATSGTWKVDYGSFGADDPAEDTSSPFQGQYTVNDDDSAGSITVTVYDNAGNSDTGTITCTEDTTAPTFDSFNLDADTDSDGGNDINPDTGWYDDLTIQGDFSGCSDAEAGIRGYFIQTGADGYGTEDADGDDVGCTAGGEGTNQDINYKITDNVGNNATDDTTVDVSIDTTAPTTTDPMSSYEELGDTDEMYADTDENKFYFSNSFDSSGTANFSCTFTDDNQWKVDYGSFGADDPAEDTASPYNGSYEINDDDSAGSITVLTFDQAGNSDSGTITCIEDTEGPTITQTGESENSIFLYADYGTSAQGAYGSGMADETKTYTISGTASDGSGSSGVATITDNVSFGDNPSNGGSNESWNFAYEIDENDNGDIIIQYTATDNVGNTGTDTYEFYEDNLAPTLSDQMSAYQESGDPDEVYGNISSNTFYFSNSFDSSCTITFTATGTDNGEADVYSIHFGNFGADTPGNDTSSDYQGQYTINDDDSSGSITVTIYDNVANSASDTITCTEDTTNPDTPTLIDIQNGVTGPNLIWGASTDNNKLNTTYLRIINTTDNTYWDGNTWTGTPTWYNNATANDTSFDFTYENWHNHTASINWDYKTYNISAKAQDFVGNNDTTWANDTFTLTEANIAPTITSLHADGTGNGNEWDQDDDDVQLDFEVNDDNGDDLWLIFNYSAGGTPGIPTNDSYMGKVKVTDGGSPGYSENNYDLDWTDATGWVDTTDDITICMRAYDGEEYSAYYNDTNLTGIDGTNPASIDPMSSYEELGDTDEMYADTSEDKFYFSNSFDSAGTANFSCTFSDATSGTWKVDYGSFGADDPAEDTSSPYNGSYTINDDDTGGSITVTVYDNAGNSDTGTITCIEDTSGPTITVTGESESSDYLYDGYGTGQEGVYGSEMAGTESYTISGTASDGSGSSGVATITDNVSFGDNPSNGGSNESWNFQYDIDAGDNGDVNITLTATDNVGNTGTTWYQFYEDNLAPTLTDAMSDYEEDGDPDEVYGNISSNTFYFSNSFDSSCTITFTATGTDNGEAGLRGIDYGSFGADDPAEDTSSSYTGQYTINDDDSAGSITVTIYDNVANSASDTITCTEDTTNPDTPTLIDIQNGVTGPNLIWGASTDNNQLNTTYLRIINTTDNTYWDGNTWTGTPTWYNNATANDTSFDFTYENWHNHTASINWDYKTYNISAKAQDFVGNNDTTWANDTFTLNEQLSAPVVLTNASTGVEETNATLRGFLQSNGSVDTTCGFRFDTDSGTPYTENFTLGVTANRSEFSNDNTSLTQGQIYFFQAWASNQVGFTTGSELTFLTKPSPPASLSGAVNTSSQIYLTWPALGTGANNTYVERNTIASWARGAGAEVYNGTDLYYEDSGVTAGNEYYYQAWGYTEWTENGATLYQYSDTYASEGPLNTGNLPVVVTNASTGVEETNATLRGFLQSNGSVDTTCGFRFDTDSGTPYTENFTLGVTANRSEFSNDNTSLTQGQIYFFQAWASNQVGFTTGSELTFLTKPSVPEDLSAQANSTSMIYLTWTKQAEANNTYIERYSSETWERGTGTEVYNGSAEQYENDGLDAGTQYFYQAWSYTEWAENGETLWQYSDLYDEASTTTLSANTAPTVDFKTPENGTTNVDVCPQTITCRVYANDTDGDTLTITWWENSTGTWENRSYYNNNVTANTTSTYDFSEFNNYNITYYWRVNVSDGTDEVSEIYHFTTEAISTSVDTIDPYEQTTSPLSITATGDTCLDNVTLWYRHSTDNASWWNISWGYRKKIDVSNNIDDHQMKIVVGNNTGGNITCEEHAQSDFDDIRFVNSTGGELPYWIENYTADSQATFWVNNTYNDTSIWMYYGNQDVGNESDGETTFPWYFENWSQDNTGDYTEDEEDSGRGKMWSIAVGCEDDFRIRFRGKPIVDTAGTFGGHIDVGMVEGNDADWPDGRAFSYWSCDTDNGADAAHSGHRSTIDDGPGSNSGTIVSVDENEWYIFDMGYDYDDTEAPTKTTDSDNNVEYSYTHTANFDDGLDYFVYRCHGNSEAGSTETFTWNSNGYVDCYMKRGSTLAAEHVYVDWAFVGKYDVNGPTWDSFGSEEQWYEWDDVTNPDEASPWSWNFDFPNSTGYYEFYSIGDKDGSTTELAPNTADAICFYNPITATLPTVVTNASTGVEETNATLRGFLQSNGTADTTCGFRWGTSSGSYSENFSVGTVSSGSNFSDNNGSLTPGQIYFFQAWAKNSQGFVNGSELTFLCKPNPVGTGSFTTSTNSSSVIFLSWTKGTGANTTYIEINASGVSVWARGAGTIVYNDTNEQYEVTGLEPGVTYYFQAWSFANWSYNPTINQFSDDNLSSNNKTKNIPLLSDESPANDSTGLSLNPTTTITVAHNDNYSMNITWYWGVDNTCPWYYGRNSSVLNGTYLMPNDSNFSNNEQTYYWRLTVNDGHGEWTNVTYHFSTMSHNKEIVTKGTEDTYSLEIHPDGNVLYGYINGESASTSIDTNWHYVSMTFDGSNIRLYKDGELEDTTPLTSSINTNESNLTLGNKLTGTLDEIRISNTARSTGWINTTYQNTNDPTSFATFGTQRGILSTWSYRKQIWINASMIDSTLSKFPVLISTTDTDLRDNAETNGYDIMFMNTTVDWDKGSYNQKIPHEIESYTSTTGELVAWVSIESLSSETNTSIYMYYGNSVCTSNRQDVENVWDSSYKAVWHLEEDDGDYSDSTSNDNDATTISVTSRSASPKIGTKSPNFDGGDDYIQVPHHTSLDFDGESFTLEAWLNSNDYSSEQHIIGKNANGDDQGWNSEIYDANDFMLQSGEGSSYMDMSTGDGLSSNNEWYHISIVWDTSSDDTEFYINGVNQSKNPANDDLRDWSAVTNDTFIGISKAAGVDRYAFNGEMDEIRLSNTARSKNWISVSYNTSNDPDNFIAFGGQEMRNVAPALSNPNPSNGATGQRINPQLSITVNDANSDAMNVTFWTNASGSWGLIGYNDSVYNGTYYQTPSNIDYPDTYWWSANVTDYTTWTNQTYILTINSYCYQETANESTVCGGLDTGNYSFEGDAENFIDGDWDTSITPGLDQTTVVYINYSKPIGSKENYNNWFVKDGAGETNLSIPNSCWNWNSSRIWLKVEIYGGNEGGGCLHGDTLLSTPKGDKKIKDLKIGDIIYSFNHDLGIIEEDKITSKYNNNISDVGNKYYYIYYKDQFDDNKSIKATYDHLFYVDDEYKMAKDLEIGDELVLINSNKCQITNIKTMKNYTDKVFDITIENNHNYYANSVLVHNDNEYSRYYAYDGSWDQLRDVATATAYEEGIWWSYLIGGG